MKKTFLVINLGLIILLCPRFLFANSRTGDIQIALQRRVSVKMTHVYPTDVLEFLGRKYGIPSGIEIISDGGTAPDIGDKRIDVNLSDVTVQQALDFIVANDARYRWEVADGVINLIPTDDQQSILNLKVEHFQIRDGSREQAESAILNLRQVRIALASSGLEAGNLHLWNNQRATESQRLTSAVSNVTLRQLLNGLAKQSTFWVTSVFGKYFWVRLSETGTEEIGTGK